MTKKKLSCGHGTNAPFVIFQIKEDTWLLQPTSSNYNSPVCFLSLYLKAKKMGITIETNTIIVATANLG